MHREPKPVIFFHEHTHRTQPILNGSMRGFKLKARDSNQLYDLRTKHTDRLDIWRARYNDEEENYEQGSRTDRADRSQLERYERQRATYENFKQRNFSQRVPLGKRTLKGSRNNLMISSDSRSLSKEPPCEPAYFVSRNLVGKMNEYLNEVIKKSHDDHRSKLGELEAGEREQRRRVSNIFMRKMKKNLRGRQLQESREEPQMVVHAAETMELLRRAVAGETAGGVETAGKWAKANYK